MFPLVAYAASPDTLDGFLGRVSQYILNPLIGLVFAAAMVYFLWGVFDFIRNNENDTDREEGKKHMLWGIIGMFIMVAVYGIIGIITGTFAPDVRLPR
ncbi:MAG: hypothetical protein AAB471_01140 [Patescibacteria group bacterium]